MGVGRRMKKQGPPPSLDESRVVIKKRKAGDVNSKSESHQKRRKADITHDPKSTGRANATLNRKPGPIELSNRTRWKDEISAKPPEPEGGGSDTENIDEFQDLDAISDGAAHSSVHDLGSERDRQAFGDDSVFDSEDDYAREKMFSEDDDVSDAEAKLTAANIEGLSRRLDQEKEADEEWAKSEMKNSAMQTNIADDRPDVFGEADVTNPKPDLAPDMKLLRTRITETIRTLGDLATLGHSGKSRADYIRLLLDDICIYYGYTPYLAEKLLSLFTPMEAFAFFEANETARPVVIRTNTLKTNRRTLAQALINRGVVLEPIGKWSKVGLQVFESTVPLGATPEYLAGHYILQAASSFLPVMALAPQPNERVLDMAAAPGGKTTYMSALMLNTGCILANDASKARAKGLIGNIHRLGCKNIIVSNEDARSAFPKVLGGFDRVLLDAPCSGTGVISKDPSVKTSKTHRDFLAIPHMQKQLLLAAIDSTDHASKTGGYIVYSTCSVTVEENEQVVQYALRKRSNVKIADTGLGHFGSDGFKSYMGKTFDERMLLARRYFPHRENVDGFFICKLKKTGPSPNMVHRNTGATAGYNAESAIVNDEDTSSEMDKAPITVEDERIKNNDAFGPFDDEADVEVIARAERNRLRRKGINPKGRN